MFVGVKWGRGGRLMHWGQWPWRFSQWTIVLIVSDDKHHRGRRGENTELWAILISSKRPPVCTIGFFLHTLARENKIIRFIITDKEGPLACCAQFANIIMDEFL
eukprot:14085406-Ditylum_brightwellii.AAC.1